MKTLINFLQEGLKITSKSRVNKHSSEISEKIIKNCLAANLQGPTIARKNWSVSIEKRSGTNKASFTFEKIFVIIYT